MLLTVLFWAQGKTSQNRYIKKTNPKKHTHEHGKQMWLNNTLLMRVSHTWQPDAQKTKEKQNPSSSHQGASSNLSPSSLLLCVWLRGASGDVPHATPPQSSNLVFFFFLAPQGRSCLYRFPRGTFVRHQTCMPMSEDNGFFFSLSLPRAH